MPSYILIHYVCNAYGHGLLQIVFYSQRFYFRNIRKDDRFANENCQEHVCNMHFTHTIKYRGWSLANIKGSKSLPQVKEL